MLEQIRLLSSRKVDTSRPSNPTLNVQTDFIYIKLLTQSQNKQDVQYTVFTHLYSNHEEAVCCLGNDRSIIETSDSISLFPIFVCYYLFQFIVYCFF